VLAQSAERIVAPGGAISIELPAGWQNQPPQEAGANLRGLTVNDEAFRQWVATHPASPLILITKYPLDHPGLNPTIKVNYHLFEGGDHDIAAVLDATLEGVKRAFDDFRIIDPPAPASLGGLPGLHARAAFTMARGDLRVHAIADMWM